MLVVAWSLNELAVLRGYIVAERAAEHRREIIGEAASLSYRAASKFAAVGLDLHPEEQRQHLIDGDAMLREFEAKLPIMRAALQDSLSQVELQTLDRFIASISHSWDDAKQKVVPNQRDELQFHLIVIVKGD